MTNSPSFPAHDVQGFGLAGFRKDHQRLLAISFGTADAGRKIMGRLADEVATHAEVRAFNNLFKEVRARRAKPGDDGEVLTSLWVAGMLSAAGMRWLGIDPTAGAPATDGGTAFQTGMAGRAAKIGDAPATGWRPGIEGAHCLIAVAGDDASAVSDLADNWSDFIDQAGGQVTWSESGATLPGTYRGHEHFGFKDGVSQPAIIGIDPTPAAGEPAAVALGEFLLGQPDGTGTATPVGGIYTDASMVVFRRLTQDVAEFRAITAPGVPDASPPLTSEQFQAKIVGRWPSGAPLEGNPLSDPGTPGNAFDYQAADASGAVSPRWSHVRKVNPRDEATPDPTADDPARHRMVRRGLPFGPRLAVKAATTDDGTQRGLHFLAVVADPARQFEFIQTNWLNNPAFPNGQIGSVPNSPYQPAPNVPADGADPVAGECPFPNVAQLQQPSGAPVPCSFPQPLVSMTGGEYFLLPTVSSIAALAANTPPIQ